MAGMSSHATGRHREVGRKEGWEVPVCSAWFLPASLLPTPKYKAGMPCVQHAMGMPTGRWGEAMQQQNVECFVYRKRGDEEKYKSCPAIGFATFKPCPLKGQAHMVRREAMKSERRDRAREAGGTPPIPKSAQMACACATVPAERKIPGSTCLSAQNVMSTPARCREELLERIGARGDRRREGG